MCMTIRGMLALSPERSDVRDLPTSSLPMRLTLPLLAALLAGPVFAEEAPALSQEVPDWAAPSAQNPYESNGPAVEAVDGPGLPGTPTPVPLDGGLGLLALAGAGYAAKKLRDRRQD